MSNQQHAAAKIRGLKGPFFPKPLELLQPCYSLWAVRSYNALRLGAAVCDLDFGAVVSNRYSFSMVRAPYHQQTSDGYNWKAALDFKIVRNGFHLGSLTILLPLCSDAHLIEGTYTDRSIAIYTTDKVADECLEQFVQLFHDALETITHAAAA